MEYVAAEIAVCIVECTATLRELSVLRRVCRSWRRHIQRGFVSWVRRGAARSETEWFTLAELLLVREHITGEDGCGLSHAERDV